jgi:hypothetical protein
MTTTSNCMGPSVGREMPETAVRRGRKNTQRTQKEFKKSFFGFFFGCSFASFA